MSLIQYCILYTVYVFVVVLIYKNSSMEVYDKHLTIICSTFYFAFIDFLNTYVIQYMYVCTGTDPHHTINETNSVKIETKIVNVQYIYIHKYRKQIKGRLICSSC